MNIHNKIIAGLILVASIVASAALGRWSASPANQIPTVSITKLTPGATPQRFGLGGNGNGIWEIQCNTTAVTTSTSGWVALANATNLPPGKYLLTFTNEGAVQGFFSCDGSHVCGILPSSSTRTENYIAISSITFTIYVERDPTQSSNLSGIYCDGHQLF